MKKIDVIQTLGILANVSVVVGIIFLAAQLNQNTALLRFQARSEIVGAIASFNQSIYENTGNVGSLIFAAQNGEAISDEEKFRLSRYMDQNLVAWQSSYLAAQDGILERDFLNPAGWRYVFHDLLPGMPEYWEESKFAFDDGFVRWMEENVVNP